MIFVTVVTVLFATLLCGAAIVLFFLFFPHSAFRFVFTFIALIALSHLYVRFAVALAKAR